MKHPTELNTLKFNTIFFPRCADNLFKVAIMFLKFNPFPLSSQEYLFFGDKDSVFNSFNLLSFTETYNDTHKYLSNIVNDLQSIQDESTWYVTRSKIYTKLAMYKTVNFDKIEKHLPYTNGNVGKELKIASIIWNNAVQLVEDRSYFPQKTEQIWELWKALTLYHQQKIDDIIPNKNLITEFEQNIHHRLHNDFFKRHSLNYEKGSMEMNAIHTVHSALNTIMLKNEIENSISDNFFNKMKKVLKI